MLRAILSLGAYLWLRTGLYFAYSRIYQFISERKYRTLVIPYAQTIKDVEDLLYKIEWESDKKRWIDTVSSPNATYGRYLEGNGSDCDDQSYLATIMINRMRILGKEQLKEVGFLTVFWRGGGHSVCVYRQEYNRHVTNPGIGSLKSQYWSYLSNWNASQSIPGFNSIQSIVYDMLCRAKKSKDQLIAWNYTDAEFNNRGFGCKI